MGTASLAIVALWYKESTKKLIPSPTNLFCLTYSRTLVFTVNGGPDLSRCEVINRSESSISTHLYVP